jgi:hypothetical protein
VAEISIYGMLVRDVVDFGSSHKFSKYTSNQIDIELPLGLNISVYWGQFLNFKNESELR